MTEPPRFEEVLSLCAALGGKMNLCGNSIDSMLDLILRQIGAEPPKMLGQKIMKLKKSKSILENACDGDIDTLLEKIERFNKNWNIFKHGLPAGGAEIPTIYKDGVLHEFSEEKFASMMNEFTQIQEELIGIARKIQ